MWGGNVRTFPDERAPLQPGATQTWREWIVPFHGTAGATFVSSLVAARVVISTTDSTILASICPTERFTTVVVTPMPHRNAASPIYTHGDVADPTTPLNFTAKVALPTGPGKLSALWVVIKDRSRVLAAFTPEFDSNESP